MSFFPKDQAFFVPFPELPLFALPVKSRGAGLMETKEDHDTRHPLRGRIENNDII